MRTPGSSKLPPCPLPRPPPPHPPPARPQPESPSPPSPPPPSKLPPPPPRPPHTPAPAVLDLSSRAIQVEATRNRLGFWVTTSTALRRAIGCSLTMLWLSPPSPFSRLFSSSAMIASGLALCTG